MVVMTMKVADLRRGINHVVFAAATEESRPILTGVMSSFEGNALTLAAVDGFRLAVYNVPLISTVHQKNAVIIPAKALREVDKLMGEEETIDVIAGKELVIFHMKYTELISTVVQGTLPNYNQLIPKNHATRVQANREDLLRAVKAGRVFAVEGSGIVRLIAEKGEPYPLAVSGRNEEIGDASWRINAVVEGEDGKIAFNSRYLVDLLSVLTEDQVILEISGLSSPGVIRVVGDLDYTHVLMPMFVQW
jgi:DNA polymerase-3 subunit beta